MRKPTLLVLLTNCNRKIYQEKIMNLVLHNRKKKVNIQFYRYEKHEKYDQDIMKLIEYEHIKHVFIIERDYNETLWNYFYENGISLSSFQDSVINVPITMEDYVTYIDLNYEYQLIDIIKKRKQKEPKVNLIQRVIPKILFVTDHTVSMSYQKECYDAVILKMKEQYGSNFEVYLVDSRNECWVKEKDFPVYLLKHQIDNIFVYHDYYGKIRNLISYSEIIQSLGENVMAFYITKEFVPHSYFNHLFVYFKENKNAYELLEETKKKEIEMNSYFNRILLARNIYYFYDLPIEKDKFLFVSYDGTQYSCNPKAISNYIIENKLPYQVVWAFQSLDCAGAKELKKAHIKCVELGSIDYYKEAITAHFWVANSRMDFLVEKRKEQVYIQTWHGGLGVKDIERKVKNSLSPEYLKRAQRDCFLTDISLTGSDFDLKVKEESFWYPHHYLNYGTPRNDILFQTEKVEGLKEKFHLPKEKKVILYAPTFRQHNDFDYQLDAEKLVKKMKKKFGGEWVFAVKFHPNILKDKEFMEEYEKKNPEVINLSGYDMQEVFLVIDALISDYSSVLFDYMYLHHPIFSYTPDYESYKKKERSLVVDVKELPFPNSESEKELWTAIENYQVEEEIDKMVQYEKKVGNKETGHACEKLMEELKKWGN